MSNPLASIQSSEFPPISFMSELEWNRLGNCPTSDLKFSSAEVIGVEDNGETPYRQQYLVATSTKSRT